MEREFDNPRPKETSGEWLVVKHAGAGTPLGRSSTCEQRDNFPPSPTKFNFLWLIDARPLHPRPNGWTPNLPIHMGRNPSSKGKQIRTPGSSNEHRHSACMAHSPRGGGGALMPHMPLLSPASPEPSVRPKPQEEQRSFHGVHSEQPMCCAASNRLLYKARTSAHYTEYSRVHIC